MPVDLSIRGADEIERVSRALKAAGASDLRKELYRGINRATKPLKDDVKRAALASLPQRGGLNRWVASARLSTRTRGGGKTPGVSITAKKSGHDLRSIDRGRVRHPVYGNRGVWVSQQVKPGFFTDTLQRGANPVRRALLDVLDDIARKVANGG